MRARRRGARASPLGVLFGHALCPYAAAISLPPPQLGALSGIEPDGDIAATELGGLRLDDYARALARLNRAEVEPQDPSGAPINLNP